MNKKPEFEPYPAPQPPGYILWIASLAALLGLLGRFLYLDGWGLLIFWPIWVGSLGLWLFLFLLRVLIYCSHRRNAPRHVEAVRQIHQNWQARNSHKAALVEAVLVGAACSASGDERYGDTKAAPEWIAIHTSQDSGADTVERERQLAKSLALGWHEQQTVSGELQPLRCYWLGSFDAWQAFVEQMSQCWPQAQLPEQPEPWRGIDSLHAIIDQLQDAPDDARVLSAGCHSLPNDTQSCLPEMGAALLWLFGPQGRLLFSRGDWIGSDAQSSASGFGQTRQSSEQNRPAQICVSFAEAEAPSPYDIRWDSKQRLRNAEPDTLDDLADMVAMTLAAWHAGRSDQTSGWLADPRRGQILGVVVPKAPVVETSMSDKSEAP
jgi:hypothetical protein